MSKKCRKCLIEKEKTRFHLLSSSSDGLQPICKACRSSKGELIDQPIVFFEGEVWKDAVGCEGYYKVSNYGRIITCKRKVKMANRKIGYLVYDERVCAPVDTWEGYLAISLRIGGKRITRRIHRMVAEAFLLKEEGLDIVNHKNGIKTDNRLENLEWCNHSQNIKHAYDTGLRHSGAGRKVIPFKTRFSQDVINKVISLLMERCSPSEIIKKLKINATAQDIYYIKYNIKK